VPSWISKSSIAPSVARLRGSLEERRSLDTARLPRSHGDGRRASTRSRSAAASTELPIPDLVISAARNTPGSSCSHYDTGLRRISEVGCADHEWVARKGPLRICPCRRHANSEEVDAPVDLPRSKVSCRYLELLSPRYGVMAPASLAEASASERGAEALRAGCCVLDRHLWRIPAYEDAVASAASARGRPAQGRVGVSSGASLDPSYPIDSTTGSSTAYTASARRCRGRRTRLHRWWSHQSPTSAESGAGAVSTRGRYWTKFYRPAIGGTPKRPSLNLGAVQSRR